MIYKRLENHAKALLKKYNFNQAPIDPEKIAKKLSIKVKSSDFAANVSGILFVDGGDAVIGYNSNHSILRQRFTIAHEIAHFILHRNTDEFFMDKQFSMLFRSEDSSKMDRKQEKEANAFAAALLMPDYLIYKEVEKNMYDCADDKAIAKLAKKFRVSEIAMTYRLTNLGYF